MNNIVLKTRIELTSSDIETIIGNISTKDLCNELFVRDAKLIVDQLHEQQKTELFQELIKKKNITHEIQTELQPSQMTNPTQARETIQLFGLDVSIDSLISIYGLRMILNTLSNFVEP